MKTILNSKDENNQHVLEFWNGDKKVTLFIENDKLTYLKSWGMSIINDMEDGDVNSIEQLIELWRWLYE